MTRGEQLVGIDFNVGNRSDVHDCKARFAQAIDQLEAIKNGPEMISDLQLHLIDEAMLRILDAQMWAVKAITAK
jgi:hypothetical protein